MSDNYINLKDKIKLFEYKNNYLMYNCKVEYEEICLEDFIYYVFERNNELPFEDKRVLKPIIEELIGYKE